MSGIEDMACEKSVSSIERKRYIGLIKHDNWKLRVYSNFGDFGNKFDDYQESFIEKRLRYITK